MATYSSILSWRILWTEEPGGLRCIELHRAGQDISDLARSFRGLGRCHRCAFNVVRYKDGTSPVPFLLIKMLFLRH